MMVFGMYIVTLSSGMILGFALCWGWISGRRYRPVVVFMLIVPLLGSAIVICVQESIFSPAYTHENIQHATDRKKTKLLHHTTIRHFLFIAYVSIKVKHNIIIYKK